MIRRHDGGTRQDDAATGTPSSVPEVGRLLRRARTRQGLRLEDVSARTGLNLLQLEALESGTVDRIPDRVVVLKTLRRYADFLGLPGDRFVLAMVDHWPSPSAAPPVVPVPSPPAPEVRPVAATAATRPSPSRSPRRRPASTWARSPGSTPRSTSHPSRPGSSPGWPGSGRTPTPGSSRPSVPPSPDRARGGPPSPSRWPSASWPSPSCWGWGPWPVHRYAPHVLDDIGITNSPTTTAPAAQRVGPTPPPPHRPTP